LERLNQSGAVPEWQIRQASRAVELFQKHYLRYRVEATPAAMVKDGELPSASAMPSNLEAAMEEVRRLVRLRHYSYRTEQTYLGWLSQYGNYVRRVGLAWDLPDTVRSFLAELALKRGVAASTQNQAFCALLFLMREVLGRDTACLNSLRAKSGPHLPVVLARRRWRSYLAWFMARLG